MILPDPIFTPLPIEILLWQLITVDDMPEFVPMVRVACGITIILLYEELLMQYAGPELHTKFSPICKDALSYMRIYDRPLNIIFLQST